ncbi:MAG TPA: ATP-binding protein [Chloroflexota bacterium]|nr:ATP-binding protein [Chloroflexota bacterium]
MIAGVASQPADFGIGRLFWTIRDGVVVVDAASGAVMLFNRPAERLLGYSVAEVAGLPVERLVPERLRPALREELEGYARGTGGQRIESGVPVELAALRKDGQEVTVELALSPLASDDLENPALRGRRFVMATVRDATERVRFLGRLRALHEAALAFAAPRPADAASVAQLLKETVARAVEALGAADGALVLRDDAAWGDLVPGARPEQGLITVRHTGEPHRRTWRPEGATWHVLNTGEPVWVPDTMAAGQFGAYPELAEAGITSFAIIPLRAGGRILGRLGFNFAGTRDLGPGDQEAMELFAGHAAAALERARYLHEQAGRVAAEAAVRARDELLAVASHDVKNPLTVIKGTADTLLRQAVSGRLPETPRVAERLARISDAAARAAAQLDELRDVARGSAGDGGASASDGASRGRRVGAESTADLVAVAQQSVETHRDAAGQRRLELRAEDGPILGPWEPVRLGRVLDNLISNAVKYSPARSTVTVSVRREASADGDWGLVEVTDEGVGIPASEQQRIFERFYRGSNVAQRVSGTGIGLSAVLAAVTQMGGSVGVRSVEGQGSTFTVRLPLGAPPESPRAAS